MQGGTTTDAVKPVPALQVLPHPLNALHTVIQVHNKASRQNHSQPKMQDIYNTLAKVVASQTTHTDDLSEQ